jgi:DNA replication protein DnaC
VASVTGEDPDELAAWEAERDEAAAAERWRRAVPSRFLWATLTGIEAAAAEVLAGWAQAPPGNLVLLGPNGVGKTWAAVAACRPAVWRGMSLVFEPSPTLLRRLRPHEGEGPGIEHYIEADRLIIDDLGQEKTSEWTAEVISEIVNWRWLEERPTVVTTNLEPEALAETAGPRLYSRLVGSGAVCLRLSGADRRREQ